ncbi:MAG: family 16 glycosylhydrolase [Spirochaetes bacterium]|nr:family 16 glycosylhydrolase [Spirochaetota bacterium]
MSSKLRILCILVLFLSGSFLPARLWSESVTTEILIWSDEFNGSSINSNYWTFDLGSQFNDTGNWSLEYFTNLPANVFLSNQCLVLRAVKETNGTTNFNSAQVTTREKFYFKYGRIEARMKLPYGYGMWPGFCMYGTNLYSTGWPDCGEIDVMEMRGGDDGNSNRTIMGTVHFGTDMGTWQYESRSITLPGTNDFSDDFHVFGVVWDPQKIVFQLDNVSYYTNNTTSHPLKFMFRNMPFFFYFNIKIGGLFFGAPAPAKDQITALFPQTMMIDWVRVYQTVTEEIPEPPEPPETLSGLDSLIAGPNPFNPSIGRGNESRGIIFNNVPPDATINIYTARGNLVRILQGSDNTIKVTWDVKNENGKECASGIYICTIKDTKGHNKTIKLIVIR